MSSLRDELKAWEASFRAEHGRDPTRQEIKDTPDIARKYKLYQQIKTGKLDANQGGKRQQRATEALSSSSDRVDRPTTPNKRARQYTEGRTKQSSATRYVVAASPSKLRQLAESHSTSGSPNRPQTTVRAIATTTTSPFKKKALPVEALRTTPSRYNPFAASSPKKRPRDSGGGGKNLFAQEIAAQQRKDEAQLRRDLLDIDKAERNSKRVPGGTAKGRGWGSGDAVSRSGSKIFADEQGQELSSRGKEVAMDVDSDDDEENAQFLGPSPVKPSLGSQSNRPRSSIGNLFETTTTTSSVTSSTAPRKLFSTSLQEFQNSREGKKAVTANANCRSAARNVAAGPWRGVKRSKTGLGFDEDASGEEGGKSDREDEQNMKSGKRYRKRATSTAKRNRDPKPNGGRDRQDEMDIGDENDDASTSNAIRKADHNVVEIELDDQDEAGKTGKIVVRQSRALYELQRDLARKRKGKNKMIEGEDKSENINNHREEIAGGTDEERGQDEWSDRDEQSLFSQVRSRVNNHAQVGVAGTIEGEEQENKIVINLPDELASILNLRTSPVKKTLRQREREKLNKVRGLLREPGFNKKRTGLLELEDEDIQGANGDGPTIAEKQVEMPSDDDWESDVEGWKDFGDGEMDDY
ncbi:hypothetical protein OIV83_002198 [Microbotryomycetes sp. JL201]|nr:hypothetical protein OIV83_002198 [Microbotryomycetes sp. JL201]